jgi:hypothetical protein
VLYLGDTTVPSKGMARMVATDGHRQGAMDGATQEIDQLEHLIQARRQMQDELRTSLVR